MAQQIKKKFIKNDAVDGSKIKLLNGQSLRIDTPAGEVELLKLGVNGEVLSKGQEVAFKSQVDALRSDLESALDIEESARIAGDQSLQSNLNVETSARIAGDQSLQSALSTETSNRIAAISAEQSARIAGDNQLSSNLQNEISRATSAENVLDDKIDQEISDRMSAVSAEESARIAGDQNLQNQINNILSNVNPEALDSLTEIVSAFQSADSNLLTSINNLGTSSGSAIATEQSARIAADLVLQGNIDTEESERIAADLVLQGNIDAEMSRAMGVEGSLQSQITQEVSNRTSADTVLQGNIDTEESERIAADLVLQGNIDSEMSRAMGVESSLQSQITQEISNRTSADSVLQGNIDTEESERVAADLVLQGNIDSEMSRAMGVESSLQSQITQEMSNRIAADVLLDSRLDALEAFGPEQTVHVSKNGSDSNSGKQHSPFLTITAALNSITDSSPTKRYIVKVSSGAYSEAIALKANVFVVGEGQKESVRITGAITMGSSFTANSSFDNRSGFANVSLLSGVDFDWNAVQSAAGKLYFSEVVFGSTLSLNGYNNATAQAQFNACVIFGTFTVSGINVGVFTNNVCYGNVTLSQHPNGGMATILVATGGYCSGTIRQTTTVNDFNRRCASFLRDFASEALIVDGLASYADVDLTSQSKQGAQKLNGGNLIALNPKIHHDLETQMIKPLSTNVHNMGDWGKQWMYNFGYVHASSGTDLYLTSVDSSYDPAGSSAGYSVNIEADGYGLKTDINGGDIKLQTATPSGSGVRGKIKLDGKEIDVTSKQIKNLADGVSSSDAVNKGQLDLVSSTLSSSISQEISDRIAGDNALDVRLDVLEADPVTKTYVDGEVSDLQNQINNVLSNIDPAALDSLTEVVSAFQSADSDIQAAIVTLGNGASSALIAEESARIAGDQTLQSNIDTEESERIAADLVLQGNIDDEMSRAMAAESTLQNNINSEMSRAMGVESSLQSQITQEVSDRVAADLVLQGNINSEISRATGVESGLNTRLTTAEGDIVSLEGRMDTAEGDIDSLELRVTETESDISTLQSQMLNAESDVDSLEVRMTTAEGDIDSLEVALTNEVSRAQSAEQALDVRLDVIEARAFGKQKIVVSSQLSYIDLEREVIANSLIVFVNRVGVHKDEDYTVSVVGGKTRLTWVNSFASMGLEAIENGDEIFVTFYY